MTMRLEQAAQERWPSLNCVGFHIEAIQPFWAQAHKHPFSCNAPRGYTYSSPHEGLWHRLEEPD
jgi:hypothetical protein